MGIRGLPKTHVALMPKGGIRPPRPEVQTPHIKSVMAKGPSAQPASRPTMARATFSALALLVLTTLLARAICSSSNPGDRPREADLPHVAQHPAVRPSAWTPSTDACLLGTTPMGCDRFQGAPIFHLVNQSQPASGRAHTRSAGKHELTAQKLDLDGATSSRPFVIKADEALQSPHYDDTLLIPNSTPSVREESGERDGDATRKIKNRSIRKTPLLMESPDWHRPKKLTKGMQARRDRIRQCLDFYYDRPLRSAEDSPWSMMHHMLAWGIDSRILVHDTAGKLRNISTIAWLCGNGACREERLLFLKEDRLHARVGAGLQGHDAQFLALLAQSRVSIKQSILVDGQEFTVADLIKEEQLTCRGRAELTFKLIAFAHYLPLDTKWQNDKGDDWSMERLIAEELRQPINGTTCGGTHRLMGFTYAAARRRQDGASMTGAWAQAEIVTRRHQQLAFRMQNPDGSFSSDFFRSSGNWGDIDRKLKTTGHVLEWLVFSLPHDELDNPQVLRATDYLCNLLASNRYYDWENGPLGHGIRALALYDERAFGGRPGHRDLKMAEKLPVIRPKPPKQPSAPPRNKSPRGFLGLRKI